MTRALTPAQMKGHKGGPQPSKFPRPGTKTRRVYDLLMENKGRPVEFDPKDFGFTSSGAICFVLESFRNFHLLDIRAIGPRGRGVKNCVWLLAGEWEGRAYIDYTVNPNLPNPQ